MPEENWLGDKPACGTFGGEVYEGPACLGYCARLPAVAEAVRAHTWAEKGQLSLIYPGSPPQAVIEAVEILGRAYNLHQIEKSKHHGNH